jgi:hypothetical protein
MVGKMAYRLELPGTMKIHNVFRVSLIEIYNKRKDSRTPELPINIVAMGGPSSFDVKKILSSPVYNGMV